ncbi:GIY-YIG nuclease family protein [Bacteroidota bacterium]
MNKNEKLKWNRILPFTSLDKIPDKVAGIYIWGFYRKKKFIPYYVGKAKNIKERLRDHMVNLCGGRYVIHKKECLDKFYENKNKAKNNSGILYDPQKPESEIKFIKERYRVFKVHIDEMVDNFHFKYAKVNLEGTTNEQNKHLRKLEKNVISDIGIEKLWNKNR